MSKETSNKPSGKELAMKSASTAIAIAMTLVALSLPARADFIADQSRISISSPKVPGLDRVGWYASWNTTFQF